MVFSRQRRSARVGAIARDAIASASATKKPFYGRRAFVNFDEDVGTDNAYRVSLRWAPLKYLVGACLSIYGLPSSVVWFCFRTFEYSVLRRVLQQSRSPLASVFVVVIVAARSTCGRRRRASFRRRSRSGAASSWGCTPRA
eukprot:8260454-Pyramimonas_sp.AAC.1